MTPVQGIGHKSEKESATLLTIETDYGEEREEKSEGKEEGEEDEEEEREMKNLLCSIKEKEAAAFSSPFERVSLRGKIWT